MTVSPTRADAAALPATAIVIGLAGPTATGKSAIAMRIAQQWPVEIVSVDSALVYRGMDIGSAKPGAAERERVPHHLIDILDPAQAYSAARFVVDAREAIAAIAGRGRIALLVGGTMLYFKALMTGLDEMPAADAAVRAQIDAEALLSGWPHLHAELARVDPATAAHLPPRDAQRIQRALEVFRLTGRPISSFQQPDGPGTGLALPLIALEPGSRAGLHRRIAQRYRSMVDGGFAAEVTALRARGDLHPGLPAIRCVGYRQWWEALDRGETIAAADDRSIADPGSVHARVIAATRQLAKRQMTWLRSMPQRHVVASDDNDAEAQAQALFERLVRAGPRTVRQAVTATRGAPGRAATG
jgi:tRNA dimethylallyltransferase